MSKVPLMREGSNPPTTAWQIGTTPEDVAFIDWDNDQLAGLPETTLYPTNDIGLPYGAFLDALLAPVADRLTGFTVIAQHGDGIAIHALLSDMRLYSLRLPDRPAYKAYWARFGGDLQAVSPEARFAALWMPRGMVRCAYAMDIWLKLSKEFRLYQKTRATEAALTVLGPTLVESPWDHHQQRWREDLRQRFTEHYATDGKQVYLTAHGRIQTKFPKSDPASFRILSEVFAADRNNLYLLGERMPAVDMASFRIVHEDLRAYLYIYADTSGVWDRGRLMKGVDPQGFTVLNRFYAHNASQVINLYSLRPILHADPDSFEILDDAGNARDKGQVYFLAPSPAADPALAGADLQADPYATFRTGEARIKTRKRR